MRLFLAGSVAIKSEFFVEWLTGIELTEIVSVSFIPVQTFIADRRLSIVFLPIIDYLTKKKSD